MQLLLIRHAKAKPYADSGRDFDRSLSRKGERQAEGLNAWLQQRMQQETLTDWTARYSPAQRTRQTAAGMLQGLEGMDTAADERIWNADVMALVDVLKDCAARSSNIILVGHNPGMEQLVMQFTGQLRPVATGSVSEIAFADGFRNARLVIQFRPEMDSI